MKDYKFVFVILHYYTINDTKKCVQSILDRIKEKMIDIVIVDNASPNGTGDELIKIYKDYSNIYVLKNEENLGFARGNNVGFEYAKKKLHADFIIMCNNDTFLLQDDFFELIIKEYNKSEFAVLGPKILIPNERVNKVIISLPDKKTVKKQLRDARLRYITNLLKIYKLYMEIRNIIKKTLILLKLKKSKENNIDINARYENIVLHGSFLIFSSVYISKFDGIDDRTFLYREEELLALRLKKNNMKNVYNPNLVIFHNEDGATNATTKNNREKEIFRTKNSIKSTKILLKELK